MKSKTINGIKVKVFETKEMRERLRLTDEEIKLVNKYQVVFYELLQEHNDKQFIIDARKLWTNLGEPQGKFADFIKRDVTEIVYKEKGKKTEEFKYKKNIDYTMKLGIPEDFDELKVENVENMNDNQLSRYGITKEYYLTINCAKKIAMQQGNKIGDIIQDYFILMEEVLRKYETWLGEREPQKPLNKSVNKLLDERYSKLYNGEKAHHYVYSCNADMCNLICFSMTAKPINEFLEHDNDGKTRDRLYLECLERITFVLSQNELLIKLGMDFNQREHMLLEMYKAKFGNQLNPFTGKYSDIVYERPRWWDRKYMI